MADRRNLSSRDSLAPLNGLRGLAVLYVVVSHLGLDGLHLFPLPHDSIGKVGVWIFFTLSAFLLTTHLVVDIEGSASKASAVLQYSVGRLFRIFPLYVLTLFLYGVLGEFSFSTVFGHFFLVEGREHFWAIPVEFQYYAVMPMLALLSVKRSRWPLFTVLTALITHAVLAGAADPEAVFSNTLSIGPKMLPFLLGSLLALYPVDAPLKSALPSRRSTDLVSLVCLATLLLSTWLYRSLRTDDLAVEWAIVVSSSIAASVVGLVWSSLYPASLAARCLSFGPLAFLGQVSFGIYLLHLLVINLVKHFCLSAYLAAWSALGLSVLVAAITYRLIEVPGIRLGNRIRQGLAVHAGKVTSHLLPDRP